MNLGRMQATARNGELSLSPGKNAALHHEQVCGFLPQKATEPSGGYRELRAAGANSLVVALLAPLALLTSDSVQKFLLAVVVLDIPMECGTYLFYRPVEASLGALKGLSISATTVALAGLYAAWFLSSLAKRSRRAHSSLSMSLPLVVFLAVTTFSVFIAQDKALSLFDAYLLFEACLIYFYIANHVRTRQDVLFLVSLLLGGCLLESVIIIIIKFTVTARSTWDFPIHIIAENLGDSSSMRIGGTIGVPNVAGAYLSVLLAAAASLFFTNLERMYKWLAAGVLVFGSVALVFTFSRGAWIALALALVLLFFAAWRRRGISFKRPVMIFAALALAYLPLHSVISARLFGDDKGSAQSRIPLNRLAFRMILDNPVLGVGANNFTVAMDRYATSEFRREWLWAVHNRYLLILAETGPAGLMAYLAFLFGTLRKGWHTWKLGDPLLSPLALGLVAGITGHMVHQSVDLFRDRPLQQLLLLSAGLLTAMYRQGAHDQQGNAIPNIT